MGALARQVEIDLSEIFDLEPMIGRTSRRYMQIVGTEYKKEFQDAMDEERSPSGVPHKPLAERSKYPRKKTRDPANHILIDKGALRAGFKYRTSDLQATIWNDVRYGKYHQGGDGVPTREIAGPSRIANDRIASQLVAGASGSNESELAFIEALLEGLDTDAEEE